MSVVKWTRKGGAGNISLHRSSQDTAHPEAMNEAIVMEFARNRDGGVRRGKSLQCAMEHDPLQF